MPPASAPVDPWLFLRLGVLLAGVACRPDAPVTSPRDRQAAGSLDTIVAMDFGPTMSCAVHRSGRATCRGDDRPIHARQGVSDAAGVADLGESQGGDVACGAPARPSPLTTRHDAVELTADGDIHCVRHASGSISCARRDADGDVAALTLPEIADARGLTLDGRTLCALATSGTPECWALSYERSFEASRSSSPKLPPFVALGAGARFMCGLSGTGAVICWGEHHYGQLGDRNAQNGVATVHGIDDAEALFVGRAQACARRRDGSVWCWGDDGHGALGDGSRAWAELPREPWHLDGVRQVVVAEDRTCARRVDGSLACWGTSSAWTAPTPVPVPEPVEFLASSERFDCALLRSGKVACRAARPSSQADEVQPSQGWWTIPDLDDVVALDVFFNIGDSLHEDGTLRTWRIDRSTDVVTQPQRFDGLSVRVHLGASYVYTKDGSVVCGAADCPFRQPLTGVTAIAVGLELFCALHADESVHCIGDRTRDQPVQLRGRHAAVSASMYNLCTLSDDRQQVKCWGDAEFGRPTREVEPELGVTRLARLPTPARDIIVGDRHMCALFPDERLTCWGSNAWGQLGDGRAGVRLVPAPYPQP